MGRWYFEAKSGNMCIARDIADVIVSRIPDTGRDKLALTVVEQFGTDVDVKQYLVDRDDVFNWDWVMSANLDIDLTDLRDGNYQDFLNWVHNDIVPRSQIGTYGTKVDEDVYSGGGRIHARLCRVCVT